jgi:glycosyltransferase involved in cell wall biosynthesis
MGPVSPVSVVIPNYNHTRYLGGAIRSALSQGLPPLEVIVVDDGSTDNSREAVEPFGAKVRYLCQSNQGLAAARNTGIRAARGDLVGFLDADDQWTPDFLEEMLSLVAENPGASVYYCCAHTIDEEDRPLPQVLGGPPVAPEAMRQKLLRANFLIPSTIVMRRDVVAAAGFFDERLRSCEDWDLWLRLLPASEFVGTSAALVRYRVHGGTLSTNMDGMQRASRAVVEKHFGSDDGLHITWLPEKRRAYGGLYRYFVLAGIQRQADWQGAVDHLRRALEVDPSIATDLDLFYDLALGGQPPGHRGKRHGLLLDANATLIEDLLRHVFARADGDDASALRHDTSATAYHAIGLLAYNTGHYSLSRRCLARALRLRPSLAWNRVLVGDMLKSLAGPLLGLLDRAAVYRHGMRKPPAAPASDIAAHSSPGEAA